MLGRGVRFFNHPPDTISNFKLIDTSMLTILVALTSFLLGFLLAFVIFRFYRKSQGNHVEDNMGLLTHKTQVKDTKLISTSNSHLYDKLIRDL